MAVGIGQSVRCTDGTAQNRVEQADRVRDGTEQAKVMVI